MEITYRKQKTESQDYVTFFTITSVDTVFHMNVLLELQAVKGLEKQNCFPYHLNVFLASEQLTWKEKDRSQESDVQKQQMRRGRKLEMKNVHLPDLHTKNFHVFDFELITFEGKNSIILQSSCFVQTFLSDLTSSFSYQENLGSRYPD